MLVKDIDPAAERARHAAASVVPARHHNIHTRRTFRDAPRARRAFIYLSIYCTLFTIYTIIIIITVCVCVFIYYYIRSERRELITILKIVYNDFIRNFTCIRININKGV
uniref:Uncharacterized protein n=1 Tax=Schizaphis graminum TaxID=13262 RepID=A0A2S2P8J3_SCHGA